MASDDRLSVVLRTLVDDHLPDAAREWFGAAMADLERDFDRARFLTTFAAAGRRLGARPPGLSTSEGERIGELSPELRIEAWGLDELGRVALLLLAVERLSGPALDDLVHECFVRGDSRERQAVLRALPLLPEPARFLALATEACRSSVQPVFDAIACENPFPARFFPQPAFNQMVLKAVFTGVAIGRIVGLPRRMDGELARMAADYARERRAAGRTVSPDLDLLMAGPGGAHEAL